MRSRNFVDLYWLGKVLGMDALACWCEEELAHRIVYMSVDTESWRKLQTLPQEVDLGVLAYLF